MPWQPTMRPAAGIPSRDAAERLRVKEAAPSNLAKMGLTAASLFPQTGLAARVALGTQLATESGDAEAAGVPWGIGRQLKNLVASGEVPERFAMQVRDALRGTAKSGNEHLVHSSDPITKIGSPGEVNVPNYVYNRMQSDTPGTLFHSHPPTSVAAPSIDDLSLPNKGADLVGLGGGARNEFTYYKPNAPISPKDASEYLKEYRQIAGEKPAQEWYYDMGLDPRNPTNVDKFHFKTDTLQYLNQLERQGKLTTQHQSGVTDLPGLGQRSTTDSLLNQYYKDILKGKL